MNFYQSNITVFENREKSLIQYCEPSYGYIFIDQWKLIKNAKNGRFGEFLKTVLPDRSISIGQK